MLFSSNRPVGHGDLFRFAAAMPPVRCFNNLEVESCIGIICKGNGTSTPVHVLFIDLDHCISLILQV